VETNKPAPRIDILGNRKLTFAFRLVLGLTLVVFGASNLPNLVGFADTVMKYKVLPESLAVPYGYALPWAEVVIGLLLIVGLGLRFVAPAGILVVASLLAGTAGSLYILGTEGP